MQPVAQTTADLDLDRANDELVDASPEDVVAWAAARFGSRLVLSTSFGATSALMLHLVSRVAPETKVICIDTGYLFPETYRFAEDLSRRFRIDVKWYAATMSHARQEALYGKMWEDGEEGVERYLRINKVEPMQRALGELGAQAWLAGLRADQTEHRAALRPVEVQNGRVKVHPILGFTDDDVNRYMEQHDLPFHPLYAQGYRSIGDHHSTLPTTGDMDPRDGRILGKKRECGLHLPLSREQNQSLKSSGL
ncbi:MAG: phosphoadenylyl-sulfate reductase [Polyangiaceae bacterium]|nr:phosphoadenylyl-sulfate reductase [Polyangiaceae bacterium]